VSAVWGGDGAWDADAGGLRLSTPLRIGEASNGDLWNRAQNDLYYR